MASISSDPNGRKRILFTAGDGSRKTIRLGKVSTRQAEAFKVRIEAMIGSSITGALDDESSRWLAGLDDRTHARVAAVGLTLPRTSLNLGPFIEEFLALRADVKPATKIVFGHTKRNLIEHFGITKSLREITQGDADAWYLHLVGEGLSPTTIRRRCGIAKQIFRMAVRRKLISANPFADLRASGQSNPNRDYYLKRADAQKVLDACPDVQWRLLFALSRYGGLRCPSEHLALKWVDVNWEKSRIIVRSPKTEHHVGGDSRVIPIFPELLPYLRDAFEAAEPGAEYVITRYRSTNANLRTQLERIIKRAGLKPWPKLFHNLRATRETELADTWPEHVVCKWIGNSKTVARKHYFQITDQHFDRAAGVEAAQNPAQQASAEARTEPQPVMANAQDLSDLPSGADVCEPLLTAGMGDTEPELSRTSLGKSQIPRTGGAESGAVGALDHFSTVLGRGYGGDYLTPISAA